MIYLYNTRTRQKEAFKPLNKKEVGVYTCGPTVYHYVHIGNLRTYIFADILRRVLEYNTYTVKHVMNITDVGHLTSDGDSGEDKMEKGSRREGKTAWEIAKFYTESYQGNLKDLNILPAHISCAATDHIQEQIDQVQMLIDKGYTYETTDGIYFDTTKFPSYGELVQLDKQELEAGARVDMGEKKNPHDFALWKFSPAGEQRQMEWDAFGRKGFPGWHIECSAMSMKYLGDQFDIHCGGIDLAPVHHTNEIAQAEAITGKHPWVTYWLHGEFILINESKMAKSGDNFITLQTLKDKGYHPLAYRYLLLQAHYRKQLNFTWEALEAAARGLEHLYNSIKNWSENGKILPAYQDRFLTIINDDLNMPEAVALVWEVVKSDHAPEDKRATLLAFDQVLGLSLAHPPETSVGIPAEIETLLEQRKQARKTKNWTESDHLRDEIAREGFAVEDEKDGTQSVKPMRQTI